MGYMERSAPYIVEVPGPVPVHPGRPFRENLPSTNQPDAGQVSGRASRQLDRGPNTGDRNGRSTWEGGQCS